jgi:hypothetical protein
MVLLIALIVAVSRPAPQLVPDKTPPPPASDAELRQRIEAYLGFFETAVPESHWRALGPKAGPVLEEIANGKGLPTRRAKALEGLVAMRGKDTPALLSRFSLDEKQPLLVRLTAVRGLAQLTPDGGLLERLRPVLETKDDRVGSEAAEVIAERVPAEGCGLVRARAANKARYQGALTTCDARR